LRLEAVGFEAFCVGGAVRDLLMGKVPDDYDIATNARPEDIMDVFEKCVATGIRHGTVTVILGEQNLEITTFRTETGYSDGRHPDAVSFVNGIEEDLSRRDFTVNAIAYSPSRGLIDPMGGKIDIEQGIIRCVGDAYRRFSEDKLRIMRCFRFASVLGFGIEGKTLAAALELKEGLKEISPERLFAEFSKLLCGDHIQLALPLFESGALSFAGINPPTLELKKLALLPKNIAARFAAYCAISESRPSIAAEFFKTSKSFARQTEQIFTAATAEISDGYSLRRLIAQCGFGNTEAGFEIKSILNGGTADKYLNMLEAARRERFPLSVKELNIGGEDIASLGFSGEDIGRVLERLFDDVLHDPSLNERARLIGRAAELK